MMRNTSYYFQANKIEILLFIILFLISFSITIYHYSVWENSEERIQHKVLALFSGDEPWFLEITSTIIHHQSISPDIFYKDPNPDPNLIFPDIYYEVDSCRLHHSLLAEDGHCYSGHQPGLSILLIPGYATGGILGAMITMNIIFTLQGILIFKFSSKFVRKKTSFICALIFSLGTILLSFSGEIYTDMVLGFFLLLILYIFFQKKNDLLNISTVGVLLGFMPFLKMEFLIFPILLIPIMCLILFKNGNKKIMIVLIFISMIFLLVFLWYLTITAPIEKFPGVGGGNAYLIRTSLSENYEEILTRTTKGLGNLLFGSSYGLFVFSPLALLSLFGMKFLWKENKKLTITLLIVTSVLILTLSFLIGYAASWTLPSRYLIPILPLTSIPLAFLIEKFSKKTVFQILLLGTLYVGVSFNILFSRIIYGHPTPEMRSDIASQVYFGTSKIFPYVDTTDPSTITNFWQSSGPFFWIFIGALITLFGVFFMTCKIKNMKQLNARNRYIIFSIIGISFVLLSTYAYNSVNDYQVEITITEMYNDILKRNPDSEGLAHWKNEVLNGGRSFEWIEDNLKNSQEGLTTKRITEMYNDILKRNPDSEGLAHWKNEVLNGGRSFEWIEDMIKNSQEAIDQN